MLHGATKRRFKSFTSTMSGRWANAKCSFQNLIQPDSCDLVISLLVLDRSKEAGYLLNARVKM